MPLAASALRPKQSAPGSTCNVGNECCVNAENSQRVLIFKDSVSAASGSPNATITRQRAAQGAFRPLFEMRNAAVKDEGRKSLPAERSESGSRMPRKATQWKIIFEFMIRRLIWVLNEQAKRLAC